MQLEEFLERSARTFPEKTALVADGRRITYGQLEADANRLAHGLRSLGVARGDRVGVYLENSIETVVSVFAVLKAGGVFLVINPTTKADKVAYILNNCRASVLITHANKMGVVDQIAGVVPQLGAVVVAGGAAEPSGLGSTRTVALESILGEFQGQDSPPSKQCIDVDLAALVYTSGSTGNPKGVMLTHLNMVAAATSITTYLENDASDVILDVLPLAFDYGLYQVLMGVKVGATVVLERSFAYPKVVIERIVKERVTGFPVLPTILAILFQMDLTRHDFSSLRYMTNTGAAMPVPFIRKVRHLFPHVRFYSMYGLTECKRVAYLPPDQIDIRPGSVGKAMPNVEVYIVDEQGRRLGSEAVGELVVRGSNVMRGYWELPEETDRMLRPGPIPGERVLHSGDLFRTDSEGYLYFVGRKDDIIKSRGEKVSPKEVENALYQLDGVAEAAVIGVPDEILGQAIKAVIKVKRGSALNEQDVLRHCAAHLENFMVPKHVEFRDELPRTSTGKISKRDLS